MTIGKRHNLFCRRSDITGRLLAVLEHEIDCPPTFSRAQITPELLESLMGKFATDWENAKTIIAGKDKTISDQAAQIAALQGQNTTLQGQNATLQAEVPDAADLAAEADVAAFVANATPVATPAAVTPSPAPDAGT